MHGGCVANMGEKKTGLWRRKLKERDDIKRFRIDEIIMMMMMMMMIAAAMTMTMMIIIILKK
jgi:hypothetical protein